MFRNTPPLLVRLSTAKFLLWRIKTTDKKLYLTFDDGPTPDVTNDILNILRQFGVKATFFCVGKNVKNHPGIYSSLKDEGHLAGNHTFNHIDGWKTNSKDYLADTLKAEQEIKSILFRPPFGRINPSQILKLRKHYIIVMWSLLSGDYDKNNHKEICLKNTINHSKPGSIVVFHDNEKSAENCLYVLPRFIDHFLELGFSFELLQDIQ